MCSRGTLQGMLFWPTYVQFFALGQDGAFGGIQDIATQGPKASVAKVTVANPATLWSCIRTLRGVEHEFEGSRTCWTIERSPQERELNKRISASLRLLGDELIGKGLLAEDKRKTWLGADWVKGSIWLRKAGGTIHALVAPRRFLDLLRFGAQRFGAQHGGGLGLLDGTSQFSSLIRGADDARARSAARGTFCRLER